MIEDALKSTRNLHRLMLAVSLVTLVFSLSLRLAEAEQHQKAQIETLLETDFLAYETWLAPKIEAKATAYLAQAIEPLKAALENDQYLVFNLDEIYEAFVEPVHIGKLLTDELVLSNLSATTLNQLNALNGLSLGQNVQITVPHLTPVVGELESFFESHPEAGKRVTNITVAVNEFEFTAQSFLPGSTVTGSLYFELVDAVAVGGTPVFQASFDAEIIELEESSFLAWLREANLSEVVELQNDRVSFLPHFNNAPRGFREEKLGTLSLRLADAIKSAGPEQRTATILGTEVPGILIVLAAPLTLMALAYYLYSHVTHLARLSGRYADDMMGFAWLPVTLGRWRIVGTSFSISGHRVETIVSTCLLPVLSLTVLYLKLKGFGGVSLPTTLLLIISAVWVGAFSFSLRRPIDQLRFALEKTQCKKAH